jgi:ATP-dependent RNA helicase DDX5/DBP2
MGQRPQSSNNAGNNLRKPNWDHETLRPFKKDFYIPHPDVSNRHPREVNDFREVHKITLKGDKVPNPIQYFEEGNFPDYVMQGIVSILQTNGLIVI